MLTNSQQNFLLQPNTGGLTNAVFNAPLKTSWAPLWSKYRGTLYKNMLPATTESYVDLGSKTVILQPWRRMSFGSKVVTIDGSGLNINPISANARLGFVWQP
jgi:hypothetical protein